MAVTLVRQSPAEPDKMNNSTEITIRAYRPDDFPAIQELWDTTGLATPGRGDDAATIERTLAMGGTLLVMCDTGESDGEHRAGSDGEHTEAGSVRQPATGSGEDDETGSPPGKTAAGEIPVSAERRAGDGGCSETIIGTSWITFDGRRLYLHHFAIAPARQGRGLAWPLLRESLRVARQMGYQVKLEVHRSNMIATALYKKAGFQYLGDYDVYIIRDIQSIEL